MNAIAAKVCVVTVFGNCDKIVSTMPVRSPFSFIHSFIHAQCSFGLDLGLIILVTAVVLVGHAMPRGTSGMSGFCFRYR